MKKSAMRMLVCVMCAVMALTSVSVVPHVSADSESELRQDIASLKNQANEIQKEIDGLKAQKSDQSAILAAIRKKIANVQAQIARCNQEINSINAKIAANKAEIDANNKKIEENKLAFKKRIRAIYMSNSDSSVKILLGAESFADYLQLAQLTSAVSAHDKQIIEDIVEAIDLLNAKNAENEKLLDSQVSVKASIAAQQKELEKEEAAAAEIYNNIAASQEEKEDDKADIEQDINDKNAELRRILASSTGSSNNWINPNSGFMWPTSGRAVSSGFGSRWGRNHNGIDIAYGGIAGQPIKAMADGTVDGSLYYSACTHNYKKANAKSCTNSSGKRCGGGYGNYVVIHHGQMTVNGKTASYSAYYAHMSSVTVSPGQKVKQGQIIGYVGCTGASTGYHLHLGLIKNGGWVDPMTVF